MADSVVASADPESFPLGLTMSAASTVMVLPDEAVYADHMRNPIYVQVEDEVVKYVSHADSGWSILSRETLTEAVSATDTTFKVADTSRFYLDSQFPARQVGVGGSGRFTSVEEVVITQVVDSTTLTVVRGAGGTTPIPHVVGTGVWWTPREEWNVIRAQFGTVASTHTKGASISRLYVTDDFMGSRVKPVELAVKTRESVTGEDIRWQVLSAERQRWDFGLGGMEAGLVLSLPAGALVHFSSLADPASYFEGTFRRVADANGVPLVMTAQDQWYGSGTANTTLVVNGATLYPSAWSADDSDATNATFRIHTTQPRFVEVLQGGMFLLFLYVSK